MVAFDLIAFDGDDTLWHTEYLYSEAQEKFKAVLARYVDVEGIEDRVYATEMRNLEHFGYGIKGFTLSLIETAIEITGGRVEGRDIQSLLDNAREMLAAEVRLLDYVADTLADLANQYTLMIITKGDLYDQEGKIARSGLEGYFRFVEIVSNKKEETYQRILDRHSVEPSRFLMVGNSPKSDILPVLAIGGNAVYLPHEITWVHEVADLPEAGVGGFFQLAHFGELPRLLERLA